MSFFKTQQFKALYQQTWPMLLGLFVIMGLANRIEYISIIFILAITMALPPMIGNLLSGMVGWSMLVKQYKKVSSLLVVNSRLVIT